MRDLTGQEFGRLRVISKHGRDKFGSILWTCRCLCGNIRQIRADALRCGKSKSCGCLQKEVCGAHLVKMSQKPVGKAAFYRLYSRYQRNADDANISFEIEEEPFRDIVQQRCFYCGTPPSQVQRAHNGNFVYNGIDRSQPSLGYVYDNIRPCCITCNIAKHTMSEQQFYAWIYRVHRHLTAPETTPEAIADRRELEIELARLDEARRSLTTKAG